MSGLTYQGIAWPGDGSLVVLDAGRRMYAGLSRDGSYVHHVHPAPVNLVDANGAVVRREGELVCTCKGSAFRGRCYRVDEAEAFERGHAQSTAWLDSPDGAGEAVEAFRG